MTSQGGNPHHKNAVILTDSVASVAQCVWKMRLRAKIVCCKNNATSSVEINRGAY